MTTVTYPQTARQKSLPETPGQLNGWEIQGWAAAALEAGRFNYQATVECLLAPDNTVTLLIPPPLRSQELSEKLAIQYNPKQAEELFDLLLDFFLADQLNYASEQMFLAAMQVGCTSQKTLLRETLVPAALDFSPTHYSPAHS